ncbi:MAG: hypothetical protein J6K77_00115 [Ruminococcus sp.]|nr:hypothetical protein [Ruminococcus sp.]
MEEKSSEENPTFEEESSEPESDERDITDVVKNENGLNYYMSKCGKFTFGISENLEITEVDDFDLAFKTDKEDGVIGMFSFSGLHQTLKGSTDDVIASYNEEYTNVAVEDSTVNGVPCRSVTADTVAPDEDETELKIRFSAFQYGNGDLIYIVYMGAADSQTQLEEHYQQMVSSIEYHGAPLKTEDETFSGKYYTVTVSPMWYIEERMDGIKIGLNLQDDMYDVFYRLSLRDPIDGKSARDAAEDLNESKKKFESTVSSEIDETEICGYDAFRVKTNTKFREADSFLESYFFDKDGKCMNITFMYPNGREEEFRNDIQPILESLEIK